VNTDRRAQKRGHARLGESAALLKPKFTPTVMFASDRFRAQLVLHNMLARDVPGVSRGERAA
jgi:hypothetical protein